MNEKPLTTINNSCVLVLWGDRFEEVTAAVLVTELRRAGLPVNLVGLTPPPVNGLYGLGLLPDLTLDQALQLAAQSICVIMPCTVANFRWLLNDPRVGELLSKAHNNQARFVMGCFSETPAFRLDATTNALSYPPPDEGVIQFARQLARLLRGENETAGFTN